MQIGPDFFNLKELTTCVSDISTIRHWFLLWLFSRDHHLPGWIQLLAHSYVTQTMYEPTSFLRDPELLSFLMDNLKPTLTLSICLEPLLVQGGL